VFLAFWLLFLSLFIFISWASRRPRVAWGTRGSRRGECMRGMRACVVAHGLAVLLVSLSRGWRGVDVCAVPAPFFLVFGARSAERGMGDEVDICAVSALLLCERMCRGCLYAPSPLPSSFSLQHGVPGGACVVL
jgi:hypothetical protein